MSNLLKLIYNEQIKIFVRKSTWAMYIILVVLVVGGAFITKFHGENRENDYTEDTWRTQLEAENEKFAQEQANLESEFENNEFIYFPNSKRYTENNYYLDNDIMPVKYGAWHFTHDNKMLLSLISLFTVIIAAGIVSSEYRWGTIKLLLIRPISRSKILLSKYISILVFSIITAGFLLLVSLVVGALFFGIEGDLYPHTFTYEYSNSVAGESVDGFVYIPLIADVFAGFGYQMVILIMMATFALLISTIFQNSSFAIGISIFLMFAGNSIIHAIKDYSWAKYILFANTDLSQYVHGNDFMITGMSLKFSIVVLVVYYVIFMIASWLVFTQRDVAGQ